MYINSSIGTDTVIEFDIAFVSDYDFDKDIVFGIVDDFDKDIVFGIDSCTPNLGELQRSLAMAKSKGLEGCVKRRTYCNIVK